MSTLELDPLSALEDPIGQLDTAVRAFNAIADAMEGEHGREMQPVLRFFATNLGRIHDDLQERFEAAIGASDDAPTPLHGPR